MTDNVSLLIWISSSAEEIPFFRMIRYSSQVLIACFLPARSVLSKIPYLSRYIENKKCPSLFSGRKKAAPLRERRLGNDSFRLSEYLAAAPADGTSQKGDGRMRGRPPQSHDTVRFIVKAGIAGNVLNQCLIVAVDRCTDIFRRSRI